MKSGCQSAGSFAQISVQLSPGPMRRSAPASGPKVEHWPERRESKRFWSANSPATVPKRYFMMVLSTGAHRDQEEVALQANHRAHLNARALEPFFSTAASPANSASSRVKKRDSGN